jgi:hypothetical protein
MAARVTRQRDQENLVLGSRNRAHRREAEPGLSLFLDHRPFLDRRDLHAAIAAALDEARPARGGAKLVGENVDRRTGEIADASRMVEIEVGRHDVAHVARAVAQIHDLPQRRLGDLEPRPHHDVEQRPEPPRLVDILDAEPSVDEDQPVIALDQEAVATHRGRRQKPANAAKQSPAERTQRPTVEMMNSHASDPPTGCFVSACHQAGIGLRLRREQHCTDG